MLIWFEGAWWRMASVTAGSIWLADSVQQSSLVFSVPPWITINTRLKTPLDIPLETTHYRWAQYCCLHAQRITFFCYNTNSNYFLPLCTHLMDVKNHEKLTHVQNPLEQTQLHLHGELESGWGWAVPLGALQNTGDTPKTHLKWPKWLILVVLSLNYGSPQVLRKIKRSGQRLKRVHEVGRRWAWAAQTPSFDIK